jgi:hypothetical protein
MRRLLLVQMLFAIDARETYFSLKASTDSLVILRPVGALQPASRPFCTKPGTALASQCEFSARVRDAV